MKKHLLACAALLSSFTVASVSAETYVQQPCNEIFGNAGGHSSFIGVAPKSGLLFYGDMVNGSDLAQPLTLNKTVTSKSGIHTLPFSKGSLKTLNLFKQEYGEGQLTQGGCIDLGVSELVGTNWNSSGTQPVKELAAVSYNYGSVIRRVFLVDVNEAEDWSDAAFMVGFSGSVGNLTWGKIFKILTPYLQEIAPGSCDNISQESPYLPQECQEALTSKVREAKAKTDLFRSVKGSVSWMFAPKYE